MRREATGGLAFERVWLHAVVAVGGAASLTIEMAGARLLAPFFGTSNLVWANVIGLTLIYLALGAWIGGRLADRFPSRGALANVVLVAALAVAVLPFATRPLFRAAADAFSGVSTGAFVGSFVGTLLVFAVPLTALGAVTPWAVRLAVTGVEDAGRTAGRLSALSTLGAIGGTFLPILVLIPAWGTRRTILVAAVALVVVAAPALGVRGRLAAGLVAAAMFVPLGAVKRAEAGERILFEGESPYQFVQVARRADGDTELHLNEGWALHSVLPRSRGLTGGVWDSFLTLPLLTGRPGGRVAILGNAGGTISNLYALAWPETRIDGVEIDPLVSDVGRRYLGMGSNARLTTYSGDARWWLRSRRTRYDAIIVDAYRQPYIPFHLVTREFFASVRDHLVARGVVAINVGTPPGETAIVDRIAATMGREFAAVRVARFDRFNAIVLGFPDARTDDDVRAALRAATGLQRGPAAWLSTAIAPAPTGGLTFTDDRAPVERLTDASLIAYLRNGAPGLGTR